MSLQITKQKSQGRVEAGKQLAEWNKKRKEDLNKTSDQVNLASDKLVDQVKSCQNQVNLTSDKLVDQVKSSQNQVNLTSDKLTYAGGALILAIVGIGFWYYKSHQYMIKVEKKTDDKKQIIIDRFAL